MKLAAVIPAYNEATRIGAVVRGAKLHTDQVFVVVDGSTDNTEEVARAEGATVIVHPENCGAGAATMTGLSAVRALGFDAVVTLDADGQHASADIPRLVETLITQGADLVILATPVNTILNLAEDVSRVIPADSIVTDVGSTKEEIVARLSEIFPNYVASHPLAGSEKRGVKNACAGIFKNSLCILTPTGKTNPKALKKTERLWHELGAKVVFLRPDIHDKALSFVSHLPHAIAFSLIGTIPGAYLKLGANSLKDTTRIALSDSCLWVDIFLSNRKNMLEAIESFQGSLSRIKSAINRKDKGGLLKILKQAKAKREFLNQ